MKVTAIYVKIGSNPFKNDPGNYKRTIGYFDPNTDYEEILRCAREAAPKGYVFSGIESETN